MEDLHLWRLDALKPRGYSWEKDPGGYGWRTREDVFGNVLEVSGIVQTSPTSQGMIIAKTHKEYMIKVRNFYANLVNTIVWC